MPFGPLIGVFLAPFVQSLVEAIKERNKTSREFDGRKSRLDFAMATKTPHGLRLARLDMIIRLELVTCANGHVYPLGEFQCDDGVDTTTSYDKMRTHSETRLTVVDVFDGSRKSDDVVRSVHHGTTYVPRTETHQRTRFGCPACKTSIYSFIDPSVAEYTQCNTVDEYGTFAPHWYHRSLRTCIVCDAGAFAEFKASGNALVPDPFVNWQKQQANQQVQVSNHSSISVDRYPVPDPLDNLPRLLAEQVRRITRKPQQYDPQFEQQFLKQLHSHRYFLAIRAAGGNTHGFDEEEIWNDAFTATCRSMGL